MKTKTILGIILGGDAVLGTSYLICKRNIKITKISIFKKTTPSEVEGLEKWKVLQASV